jgi:hypothetical protein
MTRKYNLTTGFALPLLGWQKSMYQPFLINAYIHHEEIDKYREGHLFVLLKWSVDEKFKQVCDTLSNSKLCVSEYSPDKDGNLVMFIMRIPKRLIKDYELFLNGKYSQLSERAQELIRLSAHPGGKIIRILNRDEHYKSDIEDKVGVDLPNEAEACTSIQDEHLLKKQVFTSAKVAELV